MNPQQQYNQAFPHPQQVRMYNQQAPMRVPQNAAPTGQTQVSRPAYNSGNMASVNHRQMRQQVSQGPQQTPQIRQIMITQMIPVSTQMGQNPTQFEAYHLTPSHAHMSGPSRNPHTPISEVYTMPTNGSGHVIHSSQGPPHHLQNTSQPTQVLMTIPMPLPQQRQPGFGMSAISNQNQVRICIVSLS
jgi:hypothetical protein